MADVSRARGDITGHPDVSEMRERYARMMDARDVVFLDGPVLLAGLYFAISPWVVHFSGTSPNLMVNNLILGITIALLGLGLTTAPRRMYSLCWAMSAIGVWMIISPWVVARGADAGMIANNVVVGAITCLFGLIAAGMVMRKGRETT
ncbi:SPW repeat protein [Streptomyces sp. DSM 41524]|uniref:SPW repeat protein n=4 Tax=Streptomyces violaceusniger group TaxID=2839105 RepID=A0A6G4AN71_9ACTN|nr:MULTISPECIES: SPW repeat protein [Streptomyces]MBI0381657.1 SPW repeat protein [Streptomyces albiflaviniger]MEE4594331.1 SPW repeat protein [Streptomyces sp. DSM 41524]MBA6435301.1 SPW repeat protein [Streptomyces sp. GMR22]MBI0315659.1 SPW repeat protein [Streptomyces javensis]NEW74785.1 SPW repeat protein [Streptomyces rhizosphaericus]